MSRFSFWIKGMIIMIIIIFLQFFSYTGISEDSKALAGAIFLCGLVMLLLSLNAILFKRTLVLNSLDHMVVLFILSIFFSFFTAYIYWGQPIATSFLSYRLFYIYFLYFVLVYFELTQKDVENIVLVIFFTTLIIFAINFITYPDPIFTMRTEERRNGITIFFDGQGFTFLGAFYFLQKYFKRFNLLHLMWFIIGAIFLFFLTQSRMMLAGVCFGFVLILLLSQLKYRFTYAALGLIAGVLFYFASGVFKGIKEQNKEQAQFASEDIRVQAYNFFLNDLQGGWPTMVFGNGYPAKGSKLEAITYYGQDKGFFTSDVGLTGIYSLFGLFGEILWILFFFMAFSMKNAGEFTYVKAYFLMIFVTAFTGYAIFDPGYMPSTIIALYLVRCNYEETKVIERVSKFLQKQ